MRPTPVLCFPFAGAGASSFRRWQEYPARTVQICPVQLPGREELYAEPPYESVAVAVDGLLPAALDQLGGADEVALFGHSLGAVLAYEMAHRLSRIDGPRVVHVFVSGSPAPWAGRDRRATGLSDEAFLAEVREFAGYTHPALEHPELRELLLPTLRADVALHESYRAPAGAPLAAPITSVRGADDDLVSAAEAAEWEAATAAAFRYVELPGSHMYLVDSPAAVVALLERVLGEAGVPG
jgi:surfactin synthase thioesterase subunit